MFWALCPFFHFHGNGLWALFPNELPTPWSLLTAVLAMVPHRIIDFLPGACVHPQIAMMRFFAEAAIWWRLLLVPVTGAFYASHRCLFLI